jgi:hypothetical protein
MEASDNFKNLQIRKFPRYAVFKLQIRKFMITLIRKSQICKFPRNTAQLRLKTVLKVVFLHDFLLFTNFNWSLICYICKEEGYVFAEVLSPQITKKIGSANRKSTKGNIWVSPNFIGFAIC